jgi:hypothetical protein
MTYTAPTVNYSATLNGTYTSLTGVQSVSINRGRQRFQDNFPQTSCVIELIPADTYALPLAVGQFIDVRNVNTSAGAAYFTGVITDVSRKFAMPYNSGTGAAPQDRITITATGPTGQLGKTSLSNYSVANTSAIVEIILAAGANNVVTEHLADSDKLTSAQTFTGGLLDLINTLLRTIQFLIDDIDAQRSVVYGDFITAFYPIGNASSLTFSDAGTVGAFKFSDLEYLSSVQNVFTEVEVVPAGLATQSATSGAAPYNTLVYNTFNATTANALDLAEFILATQSLVQVTPFSIATNTNIEPNCLGFAQLNVASKLAPPIGVQILGSLITVIFRGTTVTAQIQGINTTFYPEYAAVQLYLSPSLGAPFTLDSTILGVLDQNKLGY